MSDVDHSLQFNHREVGVRYVPSIQGGYSGGIASLGTCCIVGNREELGDPRGRIGNANSTLKLITNTLRIWGGEC